jgi:hypothetical protein
MRDAMLLYLFPDRDSDLFAHSRDKTRASIPHVDTAARWLMCDTVESIRLVDDWDLTDLVEAIGEVRMKGFHIFRGQYLRLHSTDAVGSA